MAKVCEVILAVRGKGPVPLAADAFRKPMGNISAK